MFEDQLLVRKTGAGEYESEGRRVLAATTEGEHHYWGHQSLLERPLALQISALFCTAAASTLSATAAAGKVQGSSSKVQQGPAPESLDSNFYNGGTLPWSSTYESVSARREKSLNYVLFQPISTRGGRCAPHPKHANMYTRKKSMGGNSDIFCIFLNVC